MAAKAKLEIVKEELEVVKAPDNCPLEEVHKYTIEQLIGRPAAQKAERVIYEFPSARVEAKKPRKLFNRMLSLIKNNV